MGMRHRAHVTPYALPGYKCCAGHVHEDLRLEHDSHLPCIHGLDGVIEMREEECDCEEEAGDDTGSVERRRAGDRSDS